ncbi:hypothetical protein [Streptomyces sp. Ag109_O5-10]|uniref:hypothetical protein n=1 Tax=Streptomyces sp. Ag109_O5-10 TaxID=1855349 RepID=UPI00089512F8|nr:hypothetical protein [Streptomyces sp. Ag109_O5-10]SEF19012.1 hypothetical protein SAMN05216533_8560 [Streptomyces sp. Ag109_O5-10]
MSTAPRLASASDGSNKKPNKKPFVPGLVPPPGALLDWGDGRHFDHQRDKPCVLCDKPTPMRSHADEPVHKACAEAWIAANSVEARLGRFASDAKSQPKKPKDQGAHA